MEQSGATGVLRRPLRHRRGGTEIDLVLRVWGKSTQRARHTGALIEWGGYQGELLRELSVDWDGRAKINKVPPDLQLKGNLSRAGHNYGEIK